VIGPLSHLSHAINGLLSLFSISLYDVTIATNGNFTFSQLLQKDFDRVCEAFTVEKLTGTKFRGTLIQNNRLIIAVNVTDTMTSREPFYRGLNVLLPSLWL